MAVIGGGPKKVLYTLQTAQRIGLLNSAKALTARNACKACGLGMGGQQGGMTNELGEFPSVCNKSVQAQSTDIQPPIPSEIFTHSLAELGELSAMELEQLGRLGSPLYKSADGEYFQEVEWSWALSHAATRFAQTSPERSFFYSSGRSSNEAGFLLQLMARLYGSNNINNCSYYCHQATGEALSNTIGTGTATVELEDIKHCDLFFLIGANPASNHPRLLHKLIELRRRGGHVIVINPLREPGLEQFAAPKMLSSMLKGGDEIASHYLQPRIGTDIALFSALAKALLELQAQDTQFIEQHTEGFSELQQHLAGLSLDELSQQCQVPVDDILTTAKQLASAQKAIFAWGMGMTHHQHGVDNIEWISNLALMTGMVGKAHAGLLPLRGHSNVQGIGTIGVKPVLAEQVFRQIEKTFAVTLPTAKGMHTLECLEAAHRGEIDAALLMGGNLYEASPDSQWAELALQRIPFKLSLTTTLNRSHITALHHSEALILPVCARDEEPEPTTQESMFNYVRLSDGGITRIANVRSEVAILADLATALLSDCDIDFQAFKKHQRIREVIAEIVPGMAQLKDIDIAKREFHVSDRLLHEPDFKTANGKVQFRIPLASQQLSYFKYSSAEASSPYPFQLMTIRSEGQFNSIIYEEQDSYRSVKHRWTVLLNQQDALELGVNEGQCVDLQSPSGEMKAVEVKYYDLPRGCAAAYYPEANILTTRAADPRSHTPEFKSTAVKITACI